MARAHPRAVYDAVLRTAAQTLLTLAADPDHLGARPGLLAVLHTWTQTLRYHPHVHVLITSGGLTPDGARWVTPPRADFPFPGYRATRPNAAPFRPNAFSRGSFSTSSPDGS